MIVNLLVFKRFGLGLEVNNYFWFCRIEFRLYWRLNGDFVIFRNGSGLSTQMTIWPSG